MRKSAKAGSEWPITPKLAAAIVAQIARFNHANERNTTTPLRLQPGAPHTAIIRLNVDSCPPPCAAVFERFPRIIVTQLFPDAFLAQVEASAGHGYPSHSLASKKPGGTGPP